METFRVAGVCADNEKKALGSYEVSVGCWEQLGAQALALRVEVFVNEQGVPFELEQDEHDPDAVHVLIREADGHAIATGRLLVDGRIGRIAVSRTARGRGLGKQVLQALLQQAHINGIDKLSLHARYEARDFYKPFGFKVQGEPFDEVGSAHVLMTR